MASVQSTWHFLVLGLAGISLGQTVTECSEDYLVVGPTTEESLVTSYLSVEYLLDNTTPDCRLRYQTPINATLYQGMIAANQQHGDNFTFESSTFANFGHFITSINGIEGQGAFYWALHDLNTGEAAEYGVDFLYQNQDDDYLWRYTEYNGGEFGSTNLTGSCLESVEDIIPAFTLTHLVVYLSVSMRNTAEFTNGTFNAPLCKRLVLTPAESTMYDVTEMANDQLMVSFAAVVNNETFEIESLNGLTNQGGFSWQVYNVTSGELFPADLKSFSIVDGGHYEFRFAADNEPSSPMPTTIAPSTTVIDDVSSTSSPMPTTSGPSTTVTDDVSSTSSPMPTTNGPSTTVNDDVSSTTRDVTVGDPGSGSALICNSVLITIMCTLILVWRI